ncbi:multidrug DMT transporter permease [Yersinia enterocolitica]|nr:multidrug DMT transporter permease [Yersinia enterocolitica]EKN3955513.1 multidrug DMT transporter permease [Yersinia enterocolitica]EKN3997045.1 multidrug DMT transporter permease [Yersinia enterocolitica]EKN4892766.1 multidrug DMT transporter permease [Yersinia enterocolitica]EKN5064947.1 multidrug DMT transporter permease [Yersinia enterocolitica]
MDDLSILIARLGWPSTATRWWTMQELAARLGESASKATTEAALLRFLSSRKLEAEVVEVLCVFWIAVQMHRYKASQKLAQSIPRPSILSDLLLESLGLQTETPITGLEEVTESFAIPQDFNGVQGTDLPRIFHTTMVNLERDSGFPFVRQMAFEWSVNSNVYPDAPFQGDHWHFVRPLGDGFIGQISSRAAIRMISAYLRTLSVAEELWSMPLELAEKMTLLALPVHPTLVLLRPRRPSWFPCVTDFDGGHEAIGAAVRSLIGQASIESPGDELIAFTSPIVISTERCVEVSVVRWEQITGGCIEDDNLAEHLKDFWSSGQMLHDYAPEPLSTTTVLMSPTLYSVVDNRSRALPMAMPIGMARLGYLQHDLYPGRLLLPTMPGHELIEIVPRNGQLEVKSGNEVVADFYYWNAGWGPVRPMQFDGNCGTALVSKGKVYRELPDVAAQDMRSFYFWRVRTLHRKGSFDSFDEAMDFGVVFV